MFVSLHLQHRYASESRSVAGLMVLAVFSKIFSDNHKLDVFQNIFQNKKESECLFITESEA